MSQRPPLLAALVLMRPAQWPILSAQLVVSMLLAAPVVGQAWPPWLADVAWLPLGVAWFSWVILLNGGTLAFNSAHDRDTGPVAYLSHPPQPPNWLAAAATGGMIIGGLLSFWLVGKIFAAVLTCCVVLSILYSHPRTRWKSRPGLDLLVNMFGYGAGTTLAGLVAIQDTWPTPSGWWFTGGFALLFGSFYPLTQIYQTAADKQRGDQTLTTALGVRTSLILALGLGSAAAVALGQGCHLSQRASWTGILILVMILWNSHLGWWLLRHKKWTDSQHEAGMYRALALWALVDLAVITAWLHG